MAKHLSCCIYCGRDTTAKSGICYRCLGGGAQKNTDRSGYSKYDDLPIEDDYSEDSNAEVDDDDPN